MEQEKVIRPRNWLYELLACAELAFIIVIWQMVFHSWLFAFMFGGTTYLILAWTLRLTLQRHHRKGLKLLRQKKYKEAAAAFQNSFSFFTKHPWIDKYCFITMFSSNAIPYGQMAVNNLGICYLHMGEDAKALEAFTKLAELNHNYPNITVVIAEIQKRVDNMARR